jgi:hypothetical protein
VERKQFSEGKVRICMWMEKKQCRERNVIYVDGKESLGGGGKIRICLCERKQFREGR